MWYAAYLDYRFTANQMSSTTNGHAAARTINHFLASLNQLGHVAEPRRSVRISEESVLAANMS